MTIHAHKVTSHRMSSLTTTSTRRRAADAGSSAHSRSPAAGYVWRSALAAPERLRQEIERAFEPSPEALIVGRVGGAGLVAIGVACWLARDDRSSRSQHGLLWGVLIYNVGTCIVLAFAGLTLRMDGVALWPVVLLHAVMTIWCAANLRASAASAR
jgi:hypothetical protein